MKIQLPYGRGWLTGTVPDQRVQKIFHSELDTYISQKSEREIIKEAMNGKVYGERLSSRSKNKKRIVLIASDHTRPVPSRLIIPEMLAQIREGNPRATVTIVIATGCHRESSKEELIRKFGKDIVNREHIIIHDCDAPDVRFIGCLKSGNELWLNSAVAEADLIVAEGFIEPHFFAGFSGGRKSILPGVSARKTVYGNHCAHFIDNENACYGVLEENPVHMDMVEAANMAGLSYIVNVVMNSKYEVIGAFAGEPQSAYKAGVNFLNKLCRQEAEGADIVITTNNGYPLDQNIYQAVKGMASAEKICREGGVIIIAAYCEDGVGSDYFYNIFRNNPSSASILKEIRERSVAETQADQWQAQIFARILEKHKVILISECTPSLVREMHMIPASCLEEAIKLADAELGGVERKISIIPDGICSILELKD